MPRKLFKRYMPDNNKLKEHKLLSWLGEHLHNPNLWHLSRRSAARAFMVGIFCALLPIPGQMAVAAVLALWIGANLPVSVSLVWITNPLTVSPIFFATYKLGSWLLQTDPVDFQWTLASIEHEIGIIWWPLLFGSLVSGIVLSACAYFLINSFWIWTVQKSWRGRKFRKLRQLKLKKKD